MRRIAFAAAAVVVAAPLAGAALHFEVPNSQESAALAASKKSERIKDADRDRDKARKALAKARDTAVVARGAKRALQEDAAAAAAALEAARTAVTNAQASRTAAGKTLASRQDRVDNLNERRRDIASRLDDQRSELAKARRAHRGDRVRSLQSAIEVTRKRLAENGEALEDATSARDDAAVQLDVAIAAVSSAVDRRTAADAKRTAAEAAAAAAEEIAVDAEADREAARRVFERAANRLARLKGRDIPFPNDADDEADHGPRGNDGGGHHGGPKDHKPKKITFSIGTRNSKRGLAAPVPIADVIGFQEAKGRTQAQLSHFRGYSVYAPNNDGASNAIAWRSSEFKLRRSATRFVHGAVPGGTPSRWINWVRLEHRKSGQQFVFVGTHFIQNAWKGGPEAYWRKPRWFKHQNELRDVIRHQVSHGLPVFVVGDMNYRGNLGLPGMRKVEQPGGWIDQMYASRGRSVHTDKQVELARRGSDHHAYRTRVTIRVRR